MKIKWRIMIYVFILVTTITVFTNVYYYNTISGLMMNNTEEELKSYTSLGLTLLDDKYPGDWRLVGNKLYKGDVLMNKNYSFIDKFAKDTNALVTIFANDTRVTTNVKNSNGNRAVGSKASPTVVENVIK